MTSVTFKAHSRPFSESATRIRARWTNMLVLTALFFASCSRTTVPGSSDHKEQAMTNSARTTRIAYLHHSTGEVIWKGGVPQFIQSWNQAHSTSYEITELAYPDTAGGHTWLRKRLPARIFFKLIKDHYPWDNYPYDYWNLWVAHTGENRDRFEMNLDDLARSYDVIVFKHCFPVSEVKPDDGSPSVSSAKQTLANYKLQYEALKLRMHQFPQTWFIVWTGPALTQGVTSPEDAERARQFSAWVKNTWDEKGDNIFVWDFRELETEGGLYLKPENAYSPENSHPAEALAAKVAPLMGRRIVDVIEGRGDSSSFTGQ
jgi:hypothetical protein